MRDRFHKIAVWLGRQASKTSVRILLPATVILLSLLIEIFGFNFWYFSLPASSRGTFTVSPKQFSGENIAVESEYLRINSSTDFTIDKGAYIANLVIQLSDAKTRASISCWNDDSPKAGYHKEYTNNTYDQTMMVIRSQASANQIHYHITIPEGQSVLITSALILNEFHFNVWRCLFMLSVGAIICALFFINSSKGQNKLPVFFVALALGAGICTALYTPPYFVFDEKEHFVKAYKIASFDFSIGENKPISWNVNSDAFFQFNGYGPPYDSGIEKNQFIRQFLSNDYSNLTYYHTTAENYTPISYIPAALGIFICKNLGLPLVLMFYSGRLFSLFFYVLVGYWVLKKIKMAQHLAFALLLMPAIFYGVCGYSADGVAMALSVALLAMFLNMLVAEEGQITWKWVVTFSLICALSAASKIAYAPLCIVILAVSKYKFRKPSLAKLLKAIPLVATGFALLFSLSMSFSTTLNQWSVPNVSTKGQLLFILSHPIFYADMVLDHFLHLVDEILQRSTMFFAYSGSLSSFWKYFIVLFLFFLAAVSSKETHLIKMSGTDKLIIFSSIALSWVAVVSALYLSFTPVGSYGIGGVNGRYFMPLLFPTFLLFSNRHITHSFKPKVFDLGIAIVSGLLLILMNQYLLVNFNY